MKDSTQAVSTGQVVRLKGFRDGLRLMVDASASVEEIEIAIKERMGNLGDSLAGTSIVIDSGNQVLSDSDLEELRKLIYDTYGLEISPDPMPSQPAPDTKLEKSFASAEGQQDNATDEQKIIERVIPAKKRVVSNSRHSDADVHQPDSPNREATCIIRHSLRSGQIERFFEGNVVLFGDVNPGAEVVAGGDVVILGRLRGLVHAGALGNIDSVIVAMNLVPTQLRIGHLITRPPQSGFGNKKILPEIATVENGNIVVKTFDGF